MRAVWLALDYLRADGHADAECAAKVADGAECACGYYATLYALEDANATAAPAGQADAALEDIAQDVECVAQDVDHEGQGDRALGNQLLEIAARIRALALPAQADAKGLALAALGALGFKAARRSFYDEEGVEGWEWEHSRHDTGPTEIGGWDEPAPPPRDLVNALNNALLAARGQKEGELHDR
jgi:hypothetical protein